MNATEEMISLQHVVKTFPASGSSVHAVNDVTLRIRRGEIYGIVGFSGAGKSTLVRCINLLEKPTSGRVVVDGVELTSLSNRALNAERKKIGMIFQQFNLFASRTVADNVAFSLRHSGLNKKQLREKVRSLLAYVELEDKADAYPSQLSGGQKQRVAIARALASDPKVLLCDEATSALDPQTTTSILRLLKRLNQETGITMVVITHQMQVVKEICERVAVMEQGRVVEEGDVFSIFSRPQQPITKSFVDSANNNAVVETLLSGEEEGIDLSNAHGRLMRLRFLNEKATQAIVSRVSRECGVDLNIIAGTIEWIAHRSLGYLVIAIDGEEHRVRQAIRRLEESGVEVEVLKDAGAAG